MANVVLRIPTEMLERIDRTRDIAETTSGWRVSRSALMLRALSCGLEVLHQVYAPQVPAPAPLASTPETPIEPLAYDQKRFFLGSLCARGHDFHGTGQSLRRKDGRSCYRCHLDKAAERREERRQAKRQ